jgi:phosphoribosyl 1,2-cyclic phosphodiesterase
MSIAGCENRPPVTAILVTHAHRDHIAGAGVLARRLGVDVYATEGTWYEMGVTGLEIPDNQRRVIDCSEKWNVGSLSIETYPTSHDALESVGYVVRDGDDSLGIATDCGVFTTRMERALRDLRVIVLEANHDMDMLRVGKYPYYLKKRIAGINGHLSNEDAGKALRKICGDNTKQIVLAHLSQENNTWDKALDAVGSALPSKVHAISVAPRCTPCEWIVCGKPDPAI